MDRLTHTYEQAGERLGVSEKTIRRIVAQGNLPVIKILGSRRIAEVDLVEFVDKHRVIAQPDRQSINTHAQKTDASRSRKVAHNVHDLVAQLTSGKRSGSKAS